MKLTAALLVALVVMQAAARAQNSPQQQPASEASDAVAQQAESELERRLNEERRKRGLEPLAIDQRLQQAAREHSLRMAEQHVLSHGFTSEPELPQRLAQTGIRFDRSGENVAFSSTVQQVHDGLMNSPQHRANILSPDFNAGGVGVIRREGLLWVTQDFVHKLEFHTEAQTENLLAREFSQARKQAGQKPVPRVRVRGLGEAACSMAEKGKLDTSRARSLFGTHSGAAAFNGADLTELPSGWRKIAQMPALNRYAIGVCFRQSQQFPSGGYWAVLVFE